MTKQKSSTQPDAEIEVIESAQAVPVAPVSVPLTLHEFCTRQSVGDSRVELIGAFESQERRTNHLKDTAENYAARFQAFINKPA